MSWTDWCLFVGAAVVFGQFFYDSIWRTRPNLVWLVVAHGTALYPDKSWVLACYDGKKAATKHAAKAREESHQGLQTFGSVEIQGWQLQHRLLSDHDSKVID